MSDLALLRQRSSAVLVGKALIGFRDKHHRQKLTNLEGRAAKRLTEMGELAHWRHSHGVLLSDPAGWIEVLVEALFALSDVKCGPPTLATVIVRVSPLDREHITDAMVLSIIQASGRPSRLMSNQEAGRLSEFVEAERADLQAAGLNLSTLDPQDEEEHARAMRRALRAREKTRIRTAKYRANKRLKQTNSVTRATCNIAADGDGPNIHTGSVAAKRTIIRPGSQAARIVASVNAGAMTASDISATTGIKTTTLRPLLTRLSRAGLITSIGRGRYK